MTKHTIVQFINREGEEKVLSGNEKPVEDFLKVHCKQIIRILTMEKEKMLYDEEAKTPNENLMRILDLNILNTRLPN